MPGFFSNTLAVLRREIYRVARQPMYWLLTVILPIVAFAFFAVLLYKGVARDIPIAVVDQDNSTLSRKVTQMIDATPTAWVAYGVQGMEEAERLMLQGKVMGIVLIPDFFEKNILNNSQTHLESYLTGTNITVNGLLAKDLQTTVTTFTAGIQLQLLMKQGLTEKQAMAQLMPVRFDKHVLFNPHINYGYYLSPSFMPMMLLIFTIMATIFVIGTELKNGTAREWYDTAGGSVFAAYAGKILPITVIMFLMSELMLLVIFKVVGVPLNGSLTVITISNLLFILSYQSLGAMIVTVLSNLRLSLSHASGRSEVELGQAAMIGGLLLLAFSNSLMNSYIAGILLGMGTGTTVSRFFIKMISLPRHCERGTGNNTYQLMWEAGVLIGFLFENMWTEGHPDTIYWICIGICVVLLLMYEFFTHPWYYRKMEEKQ